MNWFYFFINVGVNVLVGLGCYMMGASYGIRHAIKGLKFAFDLNDSLTNPKVTCMVCKAKRPWGKIDVMTHDVSGFKGFDQHGMCTINVKYCNDQEHCFEVAHVLDKWKDWPR